MAADHESMNNKSDGEHSSSEENVPRHRFTVSKNAEEEDSGTSASMQFCSRCNHQMQVRVHRLQLYYGCQQCKTKDRAQSARIYRHEFALQDRALDGDVRNLVSDPTLPRTRDVTCPRCSGSDCAYYQNRSSSKDAKMTLVYICRRPQCYHRWSLF